MFQTTFVEKINIHILCSITFFFFENPAIYEIMVKNILQPDRPQMAMWRLRIRCWLPKATNTPSEYAIFSFCTATMIVRTCLIVTLYVPCLSC